MVNMNRGNYDFDQIIERHGTDSAKWDGVGKVYAEYLDRYPAEDLLAMWIADMDFYPPVEIMQAVDRRANHHIYGYTMEPSDLGQIAVDWINRHYKLTVGPEDFVYCPGIVPAIGVAMRALLKPGDGVIITPPVYGPFARTIKLNRMVEQAAPLKLEEGGWSLDYAALEEAVDERTKMLLLCTPHNPVGRVWTAEELEFLRSFVLANDLILISDEIHADFIYSGHEHIAPATLPGLAGRTISCYAPSKSFSVAGLAASAIIIQQPDWRDKFKRELSRSGLDGNLFSYQSMRAAWLYGAPWFSELLVYLEDNRNYLMKELESLAQYGIKAHAPEASYLLYLDFRDLMLATGMESQADLMQFIVGRAGLGLNPGTDFGPQGLGYARLNFACPRSRLSQAISRLRAACEDLFSKSGLKA